MDNLGLKLENIVVKGEIALFEQFLLYYYVFKKPSAADSCRKSNHWTRLNSFQSRCLYQRQRKRDILTVLVSFVHVVTFYDFSIITAQSLNVSFEMIFFILCWFL